MLRFDLERDRHTRARDLDAGQFQDQRALVRWSQCAVPIEDEMRQVVCLR